MKIAILLKNAQGLELDRKEIEVAAVDSVAIGIAVDDAVATWRPARGDTLRIRAIDERPAPDYDTRRERWYVESALTIVSSSDVPLRERASRLVDLWERLVAIAGPGGAP